MDSSCLSRQSTLCSFRLASASIDDAVASMPTQLKSASDVVPCGVVLTNGDKTTLPTPTLEILPLDNVGLVNDVNAECTTHCSPFSAASQDWFTSKAAAATAAQVQRALFASSTAPTAFSAPLLQSALLAAAAHSAQLQPELLHDMERATRSHDVHGSSKRQEQSSVARTRSAQLTEQDSAQVSSQELLEGAATLVRMATGVLAATDAATEHVGNGFGVHSPPGQSRYPGGDDASTNGSPAWHDDMQLDGIGCDVPSPRVPGPSQRRRRTKLVQQQKFVDHAMQPDVKLGLRDSSTMKPLADDVLKGRDASDSGDAEDEVSNDIAGRRKQQRRSKQQPDSIKDQAAAHHPPHPHQHQQQQQQQQQPRNSPFLQAVLAEMSAQEAAQNVAVSPALTAADGKASAGSPSIPPRHPSGPIVDKPTSNAGGAAPTAAVHLAPAASGVNRLGSQSAVRQHSSTLQITRHESSPAAPGAVRSGSNTGMLHEADLAGLEALAAVAAAADAVSTQPDGHEPERLTRRQSGRLTRPVDNRQYPGDPSVSHTGDTSKTVTADSELRSRSAQGRKRRAYEDEGGMPGSDRGRNGNSAQRQAEVRAIMQELMGQGVIPAHSAGLGGLQRKDSYPHAADSGPEGSDQQDIQKRKRHRRAGSYSRRSLDDADVFDDSSLPAMKRTRANANHQSLEQLAAAAQQMLKGGKGQLSAGITDIPDIKQLLKAASLQDPLTAALTGSSMPWDHPGLVHSSNVAAAFEQELRRAKSGALMAAGKFGPMPPGASLSRVASDNLGILDARNYMQQPSAFGLVSMNRSRSGPLPPLGGSAAAKPHASPAPDTPHTSLGASAGLTSMQRALSLTAAPSLSGILPRASSMGLGGLDYQPPAATQGVPRSMPAAPGSEQTHKPSLLPQSSAAGPLKMATPFGGTFDLPFSFNDGSTRTGADGSAQPGRLASNLLLDAQIKAQRQLSGQLARRGSDINRASSGVLAGVPIYGHPISSMAMPASLPPALSGGETQLFSFAPKAPNQLGTEATPATPVAFGTKAGHNMFGVPNQLQHQAASRRGSGALLAVPSLGMDDDEMQLMARAASLTGSMYRYQPTRQQQQQLQQRLAAQAAADAQQLALQALGGRGSGPASGSLNSQAQMQRTQTKSADVKAAAGAKPSSIQDLKHDADADRASTSGSSSSGDDKAKHGEEQGTAKVTAASLSNIAVKVEDTAEASPQNAVQSSNVKAAAAAVGPSSSPLNAAGSKVSQAVPQPGNQLGSPVSEMKDFKSARPAALLIPGAQVAPPVANNPPDAGSAAAAQTSIQPAVGQPHERAALGLVNASAATLHSQAQPSTSKATPQSKALVDLDRKTDIKGMVRGVLTVLHLLGCEPGLRLRVMTALKQLDDYARDVCWGILVEACRRKSAADVQVVFKTMQAMARNTHKTTEPLSGLFSPNLAAIAPTIRRLPALAAIDAAKTVHVGLGLLSLVAVAQQHGAMAVAPEYRLAVITRLRALMQPGMQSKPESREMLVDYMHLCDARDRASTLEVLCVLGNTITSAYNAYKAVLDAPKLHAAAEKLTRPAEWPALAPPNQAGGNDLADGFARILSAVGAPKESRTVAITKVMNLSVTGRVELALLYVYLCDIVSRGELVELAGLIQGLGAKM